MPSLKLTEKEEKNGEYIRNRKEHEYITILAFAVVVKDQ